MDALIKALRDKQFLRDTGQGLTDSVNRGAIAGLLGGPVDAVSGVVNAGLMGLGYAGNKLGLLGADRMPQPIQKPVGGSEWIGDLLQRGKMVSENRNAPAEMLAGLLAPSAVRGASKAAFAAENNAMAPTPYNTAARNQLGATVWHGSPHKFDKFDSSKIGTGEGAQAYGHGLYLAENPKVANEYAVKLGMNDRDFSYNGVPLKTGTDEYKAAQAVYDDLGKPGGFSVWQLEGSKAHEIAKKMLSDKSLIDAKAGSLYKVDLPDEHIAKMLDWDKPLSQQSPEVQKALGPMFGSNSAEMTGQEIYKKAAGFDSMVSVASKTGGNASRIKSVFPQATDAQIQQAIAASKSAGRNDMIAAGMLKNAGIPGIRYLDQGSRNTGQGTSNFVVFPGNEGLLKILERNGQAIK